MMQGDSYGLSIEILNNEKVRVTPEDVSDVEITVGSLTKTYKNNEVTFNSDTGKWIFHLTQEETFKMIPTRTKVQLRVKWKSGGVEGCNLGYKDIKESISKEVL